MFLLRASRKKSSELKAISRHFLSLSENGSSTKHETQFLKFSHCLASRLDQFDHSNCWLRNYSSEFTETNKTPGLSGVEVPSNVSDFSNVAPPDDSTCSEEDIEHYRDSKRITVRGNDVPRPITQFSELPLPEILKEVLLRENYPEPTPIQAQGWPVAFSGRDMVGVSQTGSGKTLAYMLPAIAHVSNLNSKVSRSSKNFDIPSPKVLVLGPTRELVQQILEVSSKFIRASHLKGACAYGGASRLAQLQRLQGAEICVATPGRLLDYINNRETSLKNCSYLVLDEADRMLDMGFEPQIREIIESIPNVRQTLMWSATWPKEIRNLAEDFLEDYIHITVGDAELVANPNIQQNIYVMDEREKLDKFLSLLTDILNDGQSKVLVFAETKRNVKYLADFVQERFVSWGIHGDCTQSQRDRILKDFRRTTPSVLIATDVASRGLDISDIHHVVNFDFPSNIEDYIHRIGRTARGSAHGQSHSFFTPENCNVLQDLISVLKKTNQEISPELFSLLESNANKFSKSQNRYNYTRSYGNNRINYNRKNYGYNRMNYGNNRMSYGNNRMSYGNNRMNNDDERNTYKKDRMTYM